MSDEYKMDGLNLPSQIPVDYDYGRRNEFDLDDSSAFSVASSQYNFQMENGRLYHRYRDVEHPFPYDHQARENEEVFHTLMLFILDNKHFVAPVDTASLRNVLDLGTGLGLWVEDVAEGNPCCNVLGVDTAPREQSVLPNAEFMVFDVTNNDWIFNSPDTKFDLIHIRSLYAVLNHDSWPDLYKECFQNLDSGGWIEQIEVEIEVKCDDNSARPDSDLVRLAKFTEDMSTHAGRDFRIAGNMKQTIQDAGFVDVEEAVYKMPLGPWSNNPKYKEIGRFYERFYKTGLEGWLMYIMTTFFGYTPEQVRGECMKAFDEIDSRQHHYYMPLRIVIGRKP